MKNMIRIRELFDRNFVKYFNLDVLNSASYVASLKETNPDDRGVLYDMDIIDSKSGALIAHITSMLAVVALLIDSQQGNKYFLVFGFVSYCILASILLRCIDILEPPFRKIDKEEDLSLYWQREALIQRAICQFVQRVTIALTLLLSVTVHVSIF